MPLLPVRRRTRAAALLAAVLLAACSDDPVRPIVANHAPALAGTLLRCEARVGDGTVTCGAPAGTADSRRNVIGGQGLYVRMASNSVSYSGGIFSFIATVQNLTSAPLGTADGTTRDGGGVRVFLISPPAATSGNGTITTTNATGTATFTAAGQDYFQYGGSIGGVDQPELGADGILSPGEVSGFRFWGFAVPGTVSTFAFSVYVSAATSAAGPLASVAPQITGVSATSLAPGDSITLTGYNFAALPASNTVTIGGHAARVTGGSATQLSVVVPCVASGTVALQVAQGGKTGAAVSRPLHAPATLLLPGQSAVIRDPAAVACTELTAPPANSRYVVSIFNSSTSPNSSTSFQVSGDAVGSAAPAASARQPAAAPALVTPFAPDGFAARAEQRAQERHMELLEKNAEAYGRLMPHFARDPRMRRSAAAAAAVTAPPPVRTIRVSNINAANICTSSFNVNATRVYYSGKIAIYEDADNTPAAFKAANNPTMAANYQKIGDQFNADMEPILHANFGDVLRRDATTDNNGVLVAFFTPLINTNFSGVAGFVVSCDQFPNDTGTGNTNTASNFGEFFYAYQPDVPGTGFTANTAENWYRTIRSTFIHESKHAVAYASRTVNGAPFETAWLEEGLARTSEELWARQAVYGPLAWRGNTGYGSAGNPVNIYCDRRPQGFPECDANPRAPASVMQRHFTSLYTEMAGTNGRILSPFGRTPFDNGSYFYAISWSLIRFSVDRYATTEAQFLTALTESSLTGTANLSAAAGVPSDQLLGGWSLALAVDDYPGAAVGGDAQVPTWNFRNIYASFNAEAPGFNLVYPLTPTELGFGSFAAVSVPSIYGGGVAWYQLSGTPSGPQVIRLEGPGGAALDPAIRLAIVRVQ
ncbi:MAG TPA: IPT/TIG domain-containing protein [Longimicrobiaceae bacterium]|jgi:hypothetical protein|nr:IPT/TIG domain-containing protein [Longimicrobiaceae bacterium]